MKLSRKLATGAILAAVGVLAATTPASATVVNSSCNLSSVVRVYYDGGSYCYVWDGDKSSNFGWMDIRNARKVVSDSYIGSVRDNQGNTYGFTRGNKNKPTLLGGVTLTGIFFDAN
ncbi:hypothetical protein [Amycolatopsis sp. NPDC003676]